MGYLNIFSLAISTNYTIDQTIFACSGHGIVKSTDGGGSWTWKLSNFDVRTLTISPNYTIDQTIFAGTIYGTGVFKSSNGGTSWTAINTGMSYQSIVSSAISPNYAVDQTIFAGAGSGGVFKSVNGGGNWMTVNTGLNNLTVESIVLSPNYAFDQTIFAGTTGGGVFKSTNGGGSWSVVNIGLSNLYMKSLAISPNYTSDQTLFAGTSGGGVFKSTNGGGNWDAVNTGLSNLWVYSLAISPNYTSDQTLFAGTNGGVFKTTDSGGSWSAVNTGLSNLYMKSLAISPNYTSDQTLFAGTSGGGVFKSTNGGGSWGAVNTGLSSLYVNSLAISPNYVSDQTLFAGTSNDGVFKSTNGGGNWTVVPLGTVSSFAITSNYAIDQTIFAGTIYGTGVFKSSNGGTSWTAINTGLGNLFINSLATSPVYSYDGIILAGTIGSSVWKYTETVCSPSPEVCNGIDDDCDGLIDDGVENTYYRDADNDTYGNAFAITQACSQPLGYVSNNTDCNDSNISINPGSAEVCNEVDDNCNGQVDEGVQNTYYRDADNDIYGNASITTQACTQPSGYVSNSTDCNDGNASIKPGATEVCNGVDDNCNGQVDEGVQNIYYRDEDNDTYGNAAATTQACTVSVGYVADSMDCNDGNASVNPGAAETCNGVDDNCNGQTDEGVQNTYYRDADNDTYGNASVTTQACTQPAGYVTSSTDCNDSNASIKPGATEVCDGGVDNDCDGSTDEEPALCDTIGTVTSNVVATPNPVAVNTAVTLTANVDDSTTGGFNIASAEYSIDGGLFVMMSAVDGAFDEVSEDVTASIGSFAQAGVHSICVQGTDSAVNVGGAECILFAVYDPYAGFVTGGGWINSPEGAYTADPALTGKANFGFVSKYQNGATVPTGQTEFQFKVANLNFHSRIYEWLVVSGYRAHYKGSGTINGGGDYGFMLTAIDGQMNGTGIDRFRIKIWDKATDVIVYDNKLGASDTGDDATELGGGSIIIHNKK